MLSDKFAQGHIPRTYLALVYGGREKFRETSGLINTGLSSLGGRVHLNPDGKEARTEWEVLGSSVCLYWSYSIILARLNLV